MRALSPALITAAGFGCGAVFARLPAPATADWAAARTSLSVTRPSGPVPFIFARSTPNSAAILRATGDAFMRASSPVSILGSAAFGFSAGFFASVRFAAFSSSCGGAVSSSSSSAGAGFSVSVGGFFSDSVFFSSFCSAFFFGSSAFFSAGASSPSPPINAILSPTFTLPPSST